VAAVEAIHATGGVDDDLLAGVERVAGRGDVNVDHRVLGAVLKVIAALRFLDMRRG